MGGGGVVVFLHPIGILLFFLLLVFFRFFLIVIGLGEIEGSPQVAFGRIAGWRCSGRGLLARVRRFARGWRSPGLSSLFGRAWGLRISSTSGMGHPRLSNRFLSAVMQVNTLYTWCVVLTLSTLARAFMQGPVRFQRVSYTLSRTRHSWRRRSLAVVGLALIRCHVVTHVDPSAAGLVLSAQVAMGVSRRWWFVAHLPSDWALGALEHMWPFRLCS